MTTIQGSTVTDANPGATLHGLMSPALIGIGAILVDTVVIGARTHKVWKFPAAINTQGLDWFLDIAYPTAGAGNMSLIPLEFYDPATHLAYRMPICSSNNVIDVATGSLTGATGGTLESTQAGTTAANVAPGYICVLVLTTTSYGYWIDVTGDRVAAQISNQATIPIYSGLFAPSSAYAAKAGAKLFPLVAAALTPTPDSMLSPNSSTPTSSYMSLTRLPPVAALAQFPNVANWNGHGSIRSSRPKSPGYPRIPSGVGGVYSEPFAVPMSVVAGAGSGYPNSGILGELIGVAECVLDASVTIGSTVTIAGVDWILSSSTGAGAGGFLMKTS